MIRVEKPPAGPPELDAVGNDGLTERDRVIRFYEVPGNAGKSFTGYQAYRKPAVKKALDDLFRGKCAYCESSYAATQSSAVEHYRPKGEVTTENGTVKPGYYWLAADWDNLVPSCTDCNTERFHDLPDGARVKYGKANHFPVAGKHPRRLRPGAERREAPLLLHPSKDEPEKHLLFTDDGIVRPALDARGKEDSKATASIPVYGLQRPGLVQARKSRRLDLEPHLEDLTSVLRKIRVRPHDPALKQDYTRIVGRIKPFLRADQPYTAMARQAVARVLATFGLRLSQLPS